MSSLPVVCNKHVPGSQNGDIDEIWQEIQRVSFPVFAVAGEGQYVVLTYSPRKMVYKSAGLGWFTSALLLLNSFDDIDLYVKELFWMSSFISIIIIIMMMMISRSKA